MDLFLAGRKTEDFAGQYHTILEAFQDKMGSDHVQYVPGVAYKMQGKYFQDSIIDFNAVSAAAVNADYIVVCVGENSYTEKPGDLNDLNLSLNQQALIKQAISTGKPVILVLNEGRPLNISMFEPDIKAIIYVGLPKLRW